MEMIINIIFFSMFVFFVLLFVVVRYKNNKIVNSGNINVIDYNDDYDDDLDIDDNFKNFNLNDDILTGKDDLKDFYGGSAVRTVRLMNYGILKSGF